MTRFILTFAAVASCALPVTAAPVPPASRTSRGPISDVTQMLNALPRTDPLLVGPAVMAGDGMIALPRRTTAVVAVEEVVTKQTPDGKAIQVKQVVTQVVPQHSTARVKVDACKFYLVGKDGKLEAIEAAKATAMLKKKTAVLTGESANVDPRNLALVKPGTLCVIFQPPPETQPPPIPEAPRN
jgi:hypothetical protein